MIFEPEGFLEYPADGGNKLSFPVTSEASWNLAEETDQPYLELLENETDEHPATTGYTYNFSLTSNVASYLPRSATIKVTSSDFYPNPRTFEIRQAGTPPYFNVTDPTNLTLDYGTATTAKPVAYETNAPWYFTAGTGFSDVVASVNATAGTMYNTGAAPDVKSTGSVSFTPSTNATVGKGGTTASTTAVFTTAHGVSGLNEITRTVTLSRTIPAVFEVTANTHPSGQTIAATAATVSLTATTNLSWWLRQTSGTTTSSSATVGDYVSGSQLSVTIPARSTSDADSWTRSQEVKIEAGYEAQNGLAGETTVNYNLTRSAYTCEVEVNAVSKNSVTITVTTNAGSVPIRLNVGTADGKEVRGATPVTTDTQTTWELERTVGDRVICIVNATSGKVERTFEQPGSGGYYYYGKAPCPEGWHREDYPPAGEYILSPDTGQPWPSNGYAYTAKSGSMTATIVYWRAGGEIYAVGNALHAGEYDSICQQD
jgi:hypothetical protein